ncbi:MAG: MMPL family transporter, partial [Polyangiaceae bacterium]
RRLVLEAALVDRSFDTTACAAALEAFEHPSQEVRTFDLRGPAAWLASRHVARDPGFPGEFLAVTYLRPSGDPATDARTLEVIRSADPKSVVTGYHHLETALRSALAHDLPIVALVALGLVIVTLRAILRRASDVALALATIGVEVAAVALVMRIFHVRWHVYDALVLPVLIGITMDESMFLLHAARRDAGPESDPAAADPIAVSLREQGPLVAATALTTAAGFAALLACRFEGLFDLGAVGALGSVLGLVAALVVVPAGLRLAARKNP